MNNNKTTASKSFGYKTKIIESAPDNNSRLDTEVVISLKHLGNFWRSLDLTLDPLINCETEPELSWTKDCIISEISQTAAVSRNWRNPAKAAPETATATF